MVDRLLASQHFGERMALYWLDVVRYADTGGYHSDNHRDVCAVPRLCDRGLQRATSRSISSRSSSSPATCCRTPRRAADRLGLQPPAADDRGRRRAAEGIRGQVRRRPRAEHVGDLAGLDDGLLRVPQPQVRSVHAQGLLHASPPSSPTSARSRSAGRTRRSCRRPSRPRSSSDSTSSWPLPRPSSTSRRPS